MSKLIFLYPPHPGNWWQRRFLAPGDSYAIVHFSKFLPYYERKEDPTTMATCKTCHGEAPTEHLNTEGNCADCAKTKAEIDAAKVAITEDSKAPKAEKTKPTPATGKE